MRHHVRIIETSGAVEGRATPLRTSASSAVVSAMSQIIRSRMLPLNIGSGLYALLPMYRFERLTANGKRIDVVDATCVPSQ